MSTDQKIFSFGNWEVFENDDYRTEDVVKLVFTVRHIKTGAEFSLDHSPYERPSIQALWAYAILGFPKRQGDVAWKNETIGAFANQKMVGDNNPVKGT